jgi:hypothetical protein
MAFSKNITLEVRSKIKHPILNCERYCYPGGILRKCLIRRRIFRHAGMDIPVLLDLSPEKVNITASAFIHHKKLIRPEILDG